jgi:hypothetical protein
MVQRIKGRRCDFCQVLRKKPGHKSQEVSLVRIGTSLTDSIYEGVLTTSLHHSNICRACSQTLQSLFKNPKMEGKVLQ